MNILKAIYICGAMLFCCDASAQLASRDLVQGSGDKLLTYDANTGLEWLNLQKSGYTMSTALANIQPGGQYFGFDVATRENVLTLFLDGGVDFEKISPDGSIGITPTARQLIARLGDTWGLSELSTTGLAGRVAGCGYDSDGYATCQTLGLIVGYPPRSETAALTSTVNDNDSSYVSNHTTTFLYRHASSVPEPNAWISICGGLLLITFAGRRRHERTRETK